MGINYEKKGAIAYITINRPGKMNAIDRKTHEEFKRAWFDFRDNDDLLVAVLTGAGDKAFSAGADLKDWIPFYKNLSPVERRIRAESMPGFGIITKNFRCWKPIIAAINGFCLAGGTEMALACDLKIASKDATFGLTEVRWGIIPGGGGTQRLPRAIPLCKAMEMILAAETIDANEAYRIGLVNKVVPNDQVLPVATELAEKICQMGPLAVRAAKACIIQGLDMSLEEGLRLEDHYSEYLFSTEDAEEGPKAFAEKRLPRFVGR